MRYRTVRTNSDTDLRTAFVRAAQGCDKVFICPSDSVKLSDETLLELMDCSADVVLPVSGGKCVHPVLLSSRLAKWISVYNGSRGLKGAVEAMVRTENATLKKVNIDDIEYSLYDRARRRYRKMVRIDEMDQAI